MSQLIVTAEYCCKITTTLLLQPFNSPFSGTNWVSWYQKGKTSLDLQEQEIVSGSGISWAICTSPQTGNHVSIPPLLQNYYHHFPQPFPKYHSFSFSGTL